MRTVTAPDGAQHTVRIEWIGSRLRRSPADLRRRMRRGRSRVGRADAADGCLSVPDLDELFVVVVVVIAVVLFVLFALPTLFWLLELLIIVLLAMAIWAFRVLFRRPWRVVHLGVEDVVLEECLVVGWRRAHATVVRAAAEVQATGAARVCFAEARTFS